MHINTLNVNIRVIYHYDSNVKLKNELCKSWRYRIEKNKDEYETFKTLRNFFPLLFLIYNTHQCNNL